MWSLLLAAAIIAAQYALARPNKPIVIPPWSERGVDPWWEESIRDMAVRGRGRMDFPVMGPV